MEEKGGHSIHSIDSTFSFAMYGIFSSGFWPKPEKRLPIFAIYKKFRAFFFAIFIFISWQVLLTRASTSNTFLIRLFTRILLLVYTPTYPW